MNDFNRLRNSVFECVWPSVEYPVRDSVYRSVVGSTYWTMVGAVLEELRERV